ncbi:diguanylate cyclase [Undibacterium fentianense]|uniref:Diguanylate cyclase n=1 Tax=Undibacterium fentianense TaxID=2828728 RepID=A0A941E1U0_9BURK|nr:diguanylate cyclase [Undibacterium fentianense]MBR7799094.1 diguanylate cyclase [Undibacterium fentianense]
MPNLLRTSIVYRSSALVLGIALFVGSIFAAFTFFSETNSEQDHVKIRMTSLLSTVENTVSIACYLSDANLAKEVGQGLLKNDELASVKIFSANTVLADLQKKHFSPQVKKLTPLMRAKLQIQRQVYSPFNPQEEVCQIEVIPDIEFIRHQVNQKALFTSCLLMLQTLIMAGTLVLIVMNLITRPIKNISDRLHHLAPDANASLPLPPGNERDEIGQLVRDVNTLFSKLFHILEDERDLRIRHQIGERKFRAIFDNSETGIFLLNSRGEVLSSNPAYARLFALPNTPDAATMQASLISRLSDYALRLQTMIEHAAHEDVVSSEDFAIEVGQPPQQKWINLVLSRVENDILQGLVNDITERKMREESANQLAMTDHLTGIGNRLGFEKAIARIQFEMHATLIKQFYILMIDLDGFKQVNDQHGHEIGDQVLIRFTQILTKLVRRSDFIARTGGDEFVVLLKNIEDVEKVKSIANKIIFEAGQTITFNGNVQIRIGASIGIRNVDMADFDLAKVLHQADEAMYEAKKSGKNQFCFYKEY